MKYINASEVLPKELFEEVQKYAAGKLLYVSNETTKEWGEVSGQKQYYQKRNQMLRNKYKYGITVDELAKEYCLSKDTVKKIVYVKNDIGNVTFRPDFDSAREYTQHELLEEWVQTYLLFERKNKEFSDGLYREKPHFLGPFAMPLNMLKRNSGPEADMKWQVHPEVFEDRVNEWQDMIKAGKMLPPIIAGYQNDEFEINCNSPLFVALLRENVTYFPVIVWIISDTDYDNFITNYSPYTEFVLN